MNSNVVVSDLELTGVEQLTDAFFIVLQHCHQSSVFCEHMDSLSLAGCTHVTDLSVVYITSLFRNLKQASLPQNWEKFTPVLVFVLELGARTE